MWNGVEVDTPGTSVMNSDCFLAVESVGLVQSFQRALEQTARCTACPGESSRESCGWSCVGRRVAYRFCSMAKKKGDPKFSAEGWPLFTDITTLIYELTITLYPLITSFFVLTLGSSNPEISRGYNTYRKEEMHKKILVVKWEAKRSFMRPRSR
jgi:hypothetical protein